MNLTLKTKGTLATCYAAVRNGQHFSFASFSEMGGSIREVQDRIKDNAQDVPKWHATYPVLRIARVVVQELKED